MRETDFIERNKDKWERYEATLEDGNQDPTQLRELYVHTTDDLSISRTFYPHRSVRIYLNGLARRTFLQVNRGRRGEGRGFFYFWTEALPREVYAQRRYLLLALLTFLLSLLIGVVSYRMDPAFAEAILGADYVRMTEANIAGGDPLAVYKSRDPAGMAFHITLNNLLVALLTFLAGACFGVGSIVMLVRTGVMVGVFQYFFLAQPGKGTLDPGPVTTWVARAASWLLTAGGAGLEQPLAALWAAGRDASLFRESLLTIWIHGTLEISSFVLAGGAGLAMGGGLLFPGTLTRLQAFGRSARSGGRILLGTVPLFVVAGLLEGFVTGQSELPALLRLLFILCCCAFILWYYVIYPRAVSRRPVPAGAGEERPQGGRSGPLPLGRIRALGGLLAATFTVFRRGIVGLLTGGLALALGYCILAFAFGPDPVGRYHFAGYPFAELENFHELLASTGRGRGWSFTVLVALGFYGAFRLGLATAARHTALRLSPPRWTRELRLLLISGVLAFTLSFGGLEVALLAFLTFPYLVMAGVGSYTTDYTPGKLFRLVYTNLGHSYGILLLLLLIALPAGYLIDTVVGHYLFAFLEWIVYTDGSQLDARNVMLQAFCYYFLFVLVFCGWVIAFVFSLGSLREIETAAGLKRRIARLGNNK